MKNFSIKAKLIMLFIVIKIIPLLIISYIAVSGVLLLEEYFKKDTIKTFENSKEIIKNTANLAINDSIKMLDKKSQISLEKLSQQIAHNVANFLYERDKDLLFLSKIPLNDSILKAFYESKQSVVLSHEAYKFNEQTSKWESSKTPKKTEELKHSSIKDNNTNFHYTNPLQLESKKLPIYKEIAVFNTKGEELYKVSAINQSLLNISNKKNTYIASENYFNKIQALKQNEIYVSDVIGEYVPSKIIGSFTPQKTAKYNLEFKPEDHAYAGAENPVGKRFEGIIRFITPIFKKNKKIAYLSMALDHRHIMEFTAKIHPTKANTIQNIPNASDGNYAFMWDYEGKNIVHPRHYFIYGYNKNTGEPVKPWLSLEVEEAFKNSNEINIQNFLKTYPKFHEQSLQKKVNVKQIKEGNIALDCRYLNFAPQCNGWMEVTKDGGYGSFIIYWSKVWKLTTAATIPYYSGKYANSKRGFGFVTIGANVDEFHAAAKQTQKNVDDILHSQTNDMEKHLKQRENNIEEFITRIVNELSIVTVLMVIVVIVIAILMSKYISQKIENLLIGTQKFANNEFDYKIKVSSSDEIGQLEHSFNDMTTKISKLISEQQELNETLEEKVLVAIKAHEKQDQIIREKDNILAQQSKMAAMGEMLENIAHQWRQPLSIISTNITGLRMKQKLGMLKESDLEPTIVSITNSTKYLSNTIDDFRNFFKTDKEKELFNVKDTIDKTLNIMGSKLRSFAIEIIKDEEDLVIENYENELMQVLMNLFNNTRDQFLDHKLDRRFLFIQLKKSDKNAIIHIKDSAGGIDEKILHRIFEPYFTTKHKAQGTGIGLHMSREIITKHMGGSIEAKNASYTFRKERYKGAEFIITLPLK